MFMDAARATGGHGRESCVVRCDGHLLDAKAGRVGSR